MKKYILGAALAVGLSGPAFAQDISIATIGPMRCVTGSGTSVYRTTYSRVSRVESVE